MSFWKFVDKKVLGLVPKYYLVVWDTNQVFFPYIRWKWVNNIDFSSKLSLLYRVNMTITKVFTFLCLLCLCGNKEYPLSFQNKKVSLSFKLVPMYILFLAKLKGEGRPIWSRKTYIYPPNYLLQAGVVLTIIKVFIILFLLLGIGNNLEILKKTKQ